MKVTIHATGGDYVIRNLPGDDVLALLQDWREGTSRVLQLVLDGRVKVEIARAHIVAIETEPSKGEK